MFTDAGMYANASGANFSFKFSDLNTVSLEPRKSGSISSG